MNESERNHPIPEESGNEQHPVNPTNEPSAENPSPVAEEAADSAAESAPEETAEETAKNTAENTPEAETAEGEKPTEAPTETSAEAPTETSAEAPVKADPPAYRWTYADQSAHERATVGAKNRKGILIYAAVMTGVFMISFFMLVAVLILNNGGFSGGGGTLLRPGISAEDDEAVEGVEQAKRSVVVIQIKREDGTGTGTGVIMTSDGYIATNHHVIEGATSIKVTFYDGTVMEAKTVGSSEMDDLGVIKVNAQNLPAATFADSDKCYVGQTVYAIGTPAGADFGWTTTKGIISYKNRELKIYDEESGKLQKKLRLLQMDANVNPGNSGGPLINTSGEVIGIVSMKLANGYEGIGFAIPSDGAVEILEAIKLHGNADSVNSSLSQKRPMLGITGAYVTGGAYYRVEGSRFYLVDEKDLDQYDVDTLLHPAVSGIYIMGFTKNMDAENKLEIGDIVTAIEGEEISSMSQLTDIVNEFYAGDTVTLTVYRGRVYTPVDVILSENND